MVKVNPNPVFSKQALFGVNDVASQFKAFDVAFRSVQQFLDSGAAIMPNGRPWDPGVLADWRRNIREGVVNVGGRPSDINFFTNLMGGSAKIVTKGTDLTAKYNSYTDFNIIAGANGTYFAAPTSLAGAKWGNVVTTATFNGPYVQFTIARSNYSLNGQSANIDLGHTLYLHNEGKELLVIKIDKSVDYAWVIYATPNDGNYVVNIQTGDKLLPLKSNFTSGHSNTSIVLASDTWKTEGYFKVIQPYEVKEGWVSPFDLGAAYQDIMQFPMLFDPVTTARIDTFDFQAANNARIQHTITKNVKFFAGERLDNTYLSNGTNGGYFTQKYGGFDGLMNTIWYGGGHNKAVDNTYGFDIDVNYTEIILESDSLKLTNEYLFLMSKRFMMGTIRNFNKLVAAEPGNQVWASFKRSGFKNEDYERYMITSYKFLGSTTHIKEVGAWSDKRFIGNGPMPNMAILMPSYGSTDSNGNVTDPVEMYVPEGRSQNGNYTEVMTNDFKSPTHDTQWSGQISESIMMLVNNQENMYAMMPTTNAS